MTKKLFKLKIKHQQLVKAEWGHRDHGQCNFCTEENPERHIISVTIQFENTGYKVRCCHKHAKMLVQQMDDAVSKLTDPVDKAIQHASRSSA